MVKISHNLDQTIQIVSPAYRDRPLYLDRFNMDFYRRRNNLPNTTAAIPVSFIPTQFLSMDLLADLRDKTILTDYFVNVRKFLKLISDNAACFDHK
jgi:hypothetical protein